jgi:hypothetical protein
MLSGANKFIRVMEPENLHARIIVAHWRQKNADHLERRSVSKAMIFGSREIAYKTRIFLRLQKLLEDHDQMSIWRTPDFGERKSFQNRHG